LTETQLAEYVFVVSRTAADSEAALARGRGEFAKAAMDYTLRLISRENLAKIVANGAPAIVSAIRQACATRDNHTGG